MGFNPLEALDAIAGFRSGKIKDAQIDLLELEIRQADKKIRELEEENSALRKENVRLSGMIVDDKDFVDAGICLFKKNKDGSVDNTPLCVKCRLPIVQKPKSRVEYTCIGCKAVFGFGAILSARNKLVTLDEQASDGQ